MGCVVAIILITTKGDETMSQRTEEICALNDQLRQTLSTGLVVITPGLRRLGRASRTDRQDCLRV